MILVGPSMAETKMELFADRETGKIYVVFDDHLYEFDAVKIEIIADAGDVVRARVEGILKFEE